MATTHSVAYKLDTWHRTPTGLIVFGLLELGVAYGFGSWAIDSGSLLLYALTLLFLIGALQNMVRLALWVARPKG